MFFLFFHFHVHYWANTHLAAVLTATKKNVNWPLRFKWHFWKWFAPLPGLFSSAATACPPARVRFFLKNSFLYNIISCLIFEISLRPPWKMRFSRCVQNEFSRIFFGTLKELLLTAEQNVSAAISAAAKRWLAYYWRKNRQLVVNKTQFQGKNLMTQSCWFLMICFLR